MKRLILAIVIAFGCTGPAAAGFDEGLAAYYRLDYDTALQEWLPLADAGDSRAQYQIGVLHYRGEGLPQSYVEAAKWFRKAADRGDADAQYNLGLMYAAGRGLNKDFTRALMWFIIAADTYDANPNVQWAIQDPAIAGRSRDQATAQLDDNDVKRARRMASQFKPKS